MFTQSQLEQFSVSEIIGAMEALLDALKKRERDEREDDAFCERLLADFKSSDENEYVSLDEAASSLGVRL